jgi:hypothetical protein
MTFDNFFFKMDVHEICEYKCLMKYLYRGLRTPENSATLLKFHAMLLEKAGMGCIVRAIVDRKTA